MIKITIPKNNLEERKYILDIVFNEFLGLEYQIIESDICKNWEIELENKKKLIFEDNFFNNYLKDLEYLNIENIPSKVEFIKNEFIIEEDIPVIYGNNKLEKSETKIICGIDIFASSFFMLTRWEEYVNKKRDRLNRFSAIESLSFKNNFLDRPIVNEYIEMLWNMLIDLGYEIKRKERKFELILTHDVDFLLLSQTPKKVIIKTFLGDILKRKNIKLAFSFFKDYLVSLFSKEKDPYNTFEYLMDLSEERNLKSHFFFMAKGQTIYDNNYSTKDKFLKEVILKIKNRGHHIGIHPTFNAYNDFEQLKKEKQELEKNLETKISFGREHYLRFEMPTTWQIWEDNNMLWDSSMGYHDKEGFRCGVCYEFSVFNILTREKLNLKENPLIVMDSSFVSYQQNNFDVVKTNIFSLFSKIKKFEGNFIFLWHNSSFNNREWNKFQKIYEEILNEYSIMYK